MNNPRTIVNPTRYYVLKELKAAAALDLLVRCADRVSAESREFLTANVRLTGQWAGSGISVDVVFPEAQGKTGVVRKHAVPLQTTLLEMYQQELGKSPEVCQTLPEDAWPLAKRLPWLLLVEPEYYGETPAELVEDEHLLLSPPGMTAAVLAQAARRLSLHATAFRWAAAGEGAEAERYLVFVKDDPARDSTFPSIVAEWLQAGWRQLRSFRCGDLELYLPAEFQGHPVHPGQATSRGVCELIPRCPGLYRDAATRPKPGPFLAVVSQAKPAQDLVDCFYLGDLEPQSGLPRAPEDHRDLEVQYHDLQQSEAARGLLAEELKNAGEGYRLELRETRVVWGTGADEDELEAKRDFYEFKLHLARSARESRPTLLRFGQSQLPALADVLRRTPVPHLLEGRIEYGLFTPVQPGPPALASSLFSDYCYHYFFYQRGWTDLDGTDPLLAWKDSSSPPMKYWLDPFWARHYVKEGEAGALVFVPEGWALFPTMHGWDPKAMDAYLRQTILDLLPAPARDPDSLAQAMYVFEHAPDEPGKLRVTVLYRDKFVPFSERLSWLNEHLALVEELVLDKDFYGRLGAKANSRRLDEVFTQAAKDWEERLSTQVIAGQQAVQAAMADSLKVLDQVLLQYLEQSQRLLEQATKLQTQYGGQSEYLGQITTAMDQMSTSLIEVEKAGQTTTQSFRTREAKIRAELDRLRRDRERLNREVRERLHAEEQAYGQLRRELEELSRKVQA